jgi:hypothetical protein
VCGGKCVPQVEVAGLEARRNRAARPTGAAYFASEAAIINDLCAVATEALTVALACLVRDGAFRGRGALGNANRGLLVALSASTTIGVFIAVTDAASTTHGRIKVVDTVVDFNADEVVASAAVQRVKTLWFTSHPFAVVRFKAPVKVHAVIAWPTVDAGDAA